MGLTNNQTGFIKKEPRNVFETIGIFISGVVVGAVIVFGANAFRSADADRRRVADSAASISAMATIGLENSALRETNRSLEERNNRNERRLGEAKTVLSAAEIESGDLGKKLLKLIGIFKKLKEVIGTD